MLYIIIQYREVYINELNEAIKEIQTSIGLSQTTFAERLHVCFPTVSI